MAYTRVNWINEQEGTTTPLNAENLNTMDEGISDIDTRVTDLENTPAQADAYKTVKVGDVSLVASGADTVEFVAGSNVTLTPDSTNKTITIASTGGGGTGGHEMVSTIDDVISAETSENKVVNAGVVKVFANTYKERIIVTTTTDGNTIGDWDDTTTYSGWISDSSLIVADNDEDVELQFMFEVDGGVPIVLGGYRWENSLGKLCIKFGTDVESGTKIAVDVIHTRG